MRVLLCTIGSRGEVQPVVALASALREIGQEVRVCAPPDFREWVDGLGIPFVPLGPELRSTGKAAPAAATPERRRQLIEGTIATQFATIPAAARDCDVIVAGGALPVAARSAAEQHAIRYVYAAFCPITLPSPHHAPPPLGWARADETAGNRTLWDQDALRWNDFWGPPLNSHRAAAGLAPVTDVRGHIFTGTPWLAADPALAPWPETEGLDVVPTGAWILPDRRPLSPELAAFLDAGEPPVHLGFGSIRAPRDLGANMIGAARALGRRVIVSRGWAELTVPDGAADCLSIGEVNQQALFGRVAAVVHHGGAGTTTAAARAGAPQVVVPQLYDQHYWAGRVTGLGLGAAHPSTTDSLTAALEQALRPEVADRARSFAPEVRADGAPTAARLLGTG